MHDGTRTCCAQTQQQYNVFIAKFMCHAVPQRCPFTTQKQFLYKFTVVANISADVYSCSHTKATCPWCVILGGAPGSMIEVFKNIF